MQVILNGIFAGLSYALIAIGFNLIYSTTRFFNLAHGIVYTAGAYIAYTFIVLFGWSPWVGVPLSLMLGGLLGLSMNEFVYKPLRKFQASPLMLLLASLGLLITLQNAIALIFGDDTKVLRLGMTRPGIMIFGVRITPIQISIVLVSILLCIGVWLTLKLTQVGKLIRAVASDPELARIMGVNSDRAISFTFLIGSILAATAGVLIGYDTDLTPSMGFRALLMGVVSVIAGGVGNVQGAVMGGLLIGLVQHIGAWIFPTQWQDAIIFIILIGFLLIRPQGFFGSPLRKSSV